METSHLRELQNHFETGRALTPEAQQLYKKSEDLISQFQQKFDRNKLLSMTLQEYIVGQKNRDTFCYWLEHKTGDVGSIGIGGAGYGFGVYYNKKEGAYKVGGGKQSKVVSEDEANEELEKIKTGLIKLLSSAERLDLEEMNIISKELPLDQQTIGKILTLYFPDKYLGVFSSRHLDEFLESLGLIDAKTKDLNVFEKRAILLEFKKKDEIMKNWPNRKFVDFLYEEIKTSNEPPELSYFILRTGGGDYSDQPKLKYNFKEGILGYKQLNAAKGSARFVYLENGSFYAKGKIGKIKSYEKDGIKYFDAKVLDYEKMEPIRFEDLRNKLSITPNQAGILKISEEDYKTITGLGKQENSSKDKDENSLFENIKNLLESKKQIILYGPPGTGKTYLARTFSEWLLKKPFNELNEKNQVCFITFHPSYSYEEFVEGITANTDIETESSSSIQYVRKWGIFKKLCTRALASAINKSLDQKKALWEDQWNAIFTKFQDLANKKSRSQLNDEEWKGSEIFVLIIDEINRGDISKILGELVTLLENDKRLSQQNEIIVNLPYSNDKFGVPPNLYIIGTMNTADRSVALVDIALRRRFGFIEMAPNFKELRQKHLLKNENQLKNNGIYDILQKSIEALDKINKNIIRELGRDKQIGHSFFFKAFTKEDLIMVWQHEILPLMEEYFYCDYEKIVRTLEIDKKDPFVNEQIGIKGFQNIDELEVFLTNIIGEKGTEDA